MGDTLLAGYLFSQHVDHVSLGAAHPSSSALYSSAYQAWMVLGISGRKYKLTRLVVYLQKVGNPTGNLECVLYNITGDRMSDAIPTGAKLASSELVGIASVGTEYHDITFYFVGANQIELTSGQELSFDVRVHDGEFGEGEFVRVARGITLVNGVHGAWWNGEWHCIG